MYLSINKIQTFKFLYSILSYNVVCYCVWTRNKTVFFAIYCRQLKQINKIKKIPGQGPDL